MKLTQLSILALQIETQTLNVGISGKLPDFSPVVNLRVLDLSGNHFSVSVLLLLWHLSMKRIMDLQAVDTADFFLPSFETFDSIQREQYPPQ
jgi:hypothetical protein